jgi:glutamyl-tRNA reductase
MFHCRSISHHHTPLIIREQLSLTTRQQVEWLSAPRREEVVVVATCNRLELYAYAPSVKVMDALWADLLAVRRVTPQEVESCTVALSDFDAVQHVFRVGCGLESMALGEPQILGQITHAYEPAHEYGAAGAMLSLLFRAAIFAAKRARSETAIGSGAASVSSLGIAKAESAQGPLAERAILVIGAGEMGQTVVKALVQRGVRQVTIVSRTYDHARRLADEWQVSARPITELKEALTEADVLFTTSGAPFTILAREDVAPVMNLRPNRPLCMIDIAMPRDIDPAVAEIPGVCLHDLDDLQHVIETSLAERQANVPAVEAIIEHELALFWSDYQARAVAPTIRLLREHAEQLRQAELSWAYNRLPPGCEEERLLMDQFSHRLMNKMLHQLTRNLKAKASQEDAALIAAVARDLFGLEDNVMFE